MDEAKRTTLPILTDPLDREFFEAAKRHELLIQQCRDCGQYVFYPKHMCSHCLSENLVWTRSSGKGKVYSFTVIRGSAPTDFTDQVPYVVAIIELAEGVRLLCNVVGCVPDDVRCDMPVEVVFDHVTETVCLPKFSPSAQ